MPVPEQNHFFLERARPFGHAVKPPAAQFHHVLALQPGLLLLQLLLFLRRAMLIDIADLSQPLRVGPGPGRIRRGIGNIFVIEQESNRLVRAEAGQPFNLPGGPPNPARFNKCAALA